MTYSIKMEKEKGIFQESLNMLMVMLAIDKPIPVYDFVRQIQ